LILLLTLGHDESGDTSGGDGRAHGVPLLVHVDLPVPPTPGLSGREHVSSAAHVAEGSLARSVGTTATNAGNTRNGATGTPRLGRGLVA
jgi:hypothetical protein